MAALLQLATIVAHVGLALSPWVRTLFARFPICLLFATQQVCSTVTAISVFSIGPFINLSFILTCVSLWRAGLVDVLRGVIQGRNIQGHNDVVRVWQFSPFTELFLFLMPCSLSYVVWLFLYVRRKWTVNFLEPIQALHLETSVVFALGTIIIGFYLFIANTFPAVMNAVQNLHRNRFRLHNIMLVTLNIALVSYCFSVIVLLDSKSEKWDVIAMAVAEIMYRAVCIVVVIRLRAPFEAPQLQNAEAQQPQNQKVDNALEDAPPPAIEAPNCHEHDDSKNTPPPINISDPTPSTEGSFVEQPNYRMEIYRPVTKESFVQPFFSPNPPM